MNNQQTFAVLDLGSNSFHMLIAKVDEQQNIQIVDKLKDRVRLAGGLDENKNLTPEIQTRAFQHFAQYADRLRGISSDQIRVVATDTFRRAKNGQPFLEQSEQILEHPIEIISGLEEARLIHKGVTHDFPSPTQRLIIDIGGGSTELIIASGNKIHHLASTKMGCVSWTTQFFQTGWTAENFQRAIAHAKQILAPHLLIYRKIGWIDVVGTSGTIKALEGLGMALGYSVLTVEALEDLYKRMPHQANDPLWSTISTSRREVLAGGLSILYAIFQDFQIQQLQWLSAALREGVLIDMLGKISGDDIRQKSVEALVQRFTVDEEHIFRIIKTLETFLQSTTWYFSLIEQQFLRWAIYLHEVGLTIGFAGYHRHSAYIVAHADLAGFSRNDQQTLAMLIDHHRGKIKWPSLVHYLPEITDTQKQMLTLLRLCIRFHRKRLSMTMDWIEGAIETNNNTLTLNIPQTLFELEPLLQADLEYERVQLETLGIRLQF